LRYERTRGNYCQGVGGQAGDVQVNAVQGGQVTVLELKVRPTDLGKVIGRQGRMAKSIRTILAAAGMKLNERLTLEILEYLQRFVSAATIPTERSWVNNPAG
jgi:predicted RNA-binding protein YlqC (UPF0109 family)